MKLHLMSLRHICTINDKYFLAKLNFSGNTDYSQGLSKFMPLASTSFVLRALAPCFAQSLWRQSCYLSIVAACLAFRRRLATCPIAVPRLLLRLRR